MATMAVGLWGQTGPLQKANTFLALLQSHLPSTLAHPSSFRRPATSVYTMLTDPSMVPLTRSVGSRMSTSSASRSFMAFKTSISPTGCTPGTGTMG